MYRESIMKNWIEKIMLSLSAICILFFLIAVAAAHIADLNTPRTECYGQAEVIGKRLVIESGGDASNNYYMLVVFKLYGDYIIELYQGHGSFHEGDTGILVYTEREDTRKKYENETDYWKGRSLISFGKDPEYGGEKIGGRKERGVFYTVSGISAGFLVFIILFYYFKDKRRRDFYKSISKPSKTHTPRRWR